MPVADVIYFRDSDGAVPVLDWLRDLANRDRRAASKSVAQLELLRQYGHELRRPTADYLRDGVHELRVRVGRSQHRILYFFQGKNVIVLTHGLTKESAVPAKDIDRAIRRMEQFKENPALHTHYMEASDG